MTALRLLSALSIITFAFAIGSCNPEPPKAESNPYADIKAGSPVDSVYEVLKIAGQDTHRVKALNALCWYLRRENPDTAIIVGEQAVKLADELQFTRWQSKTHNNVAVAYRLIADHKKALEHGERALDYATLLNDSSEVAICNGTIGAIYYVQGNYPRALDHYLLALKMGEAMQDTATIATQLTNIGALFIMQNELDSSIRYYRRALVLDRAKSDSTGISFDLSGIAASYGRLEQMDSALYYYTEAYAIELRQGTKYGLERVIGSLGICWAQRADFIKDDTLQRMYRDSAIVYYTRAIELARELNDRRGASLNLNNLGRVNIDIGHYREAEQYLSEAAEISDSLDILEIQKDVEANLSRLYDSLGRPAEAFSHYRNYITLRDSLVNDDKTDQMTRAQMNFEFEKERAVQQAKTDEQLARQRLMLNVSIAGGLLLLIIAGVSVRAYRIKKKSSEIISLQKREVEEQKALVDIKQQAIIDSINYAQRIQSAILPAITDIEKQFGDAFVFFEPKDIVSGDFYWTAKTNDYSFIVVADCTGHGVPGGFMSMLGHSLLSEIVLEKQITDTGEILNQLRAKIIRVLKQTGGSGENKDGMDLVICRFSNDFRKLTFSCALNPLWICRDQQIIEFKGDKQPVGISVAGHMTEFRTQETELHPGDCIYLFTDGYADQFGGPDGKKFKYKVLKELLAGSQLLPMLRQKDILEKTFHTWKGDLMQIDDVLVVGIKIR